MTPRSSEGTHLYRVPHQRGRVAVVTGANSGTGLEAATRLAGAGATVVLAVRNQAKGELAREGILEQHPEADLQVRLLDLANLASVKTFSDQLLRDPRPLHLLVNNAGVMRPPHRNETIDGFELQMGTNFLGPFALTLRLLPKLLDAESPRVATMSSIVAIVGSIRFDDPQWRRHYRANRAYAQTKLADLLFAQRLAAISAERRWNLVSTAAHPGYARTNLLIAGASLGRARPRRAWTSRVMLLPSQGVEQGTEPMLYAATSADAINGAYYGPSRLFGLVGPTTIVRAPRRSKKSGLAVRLWDLAEELTGVSLPRAP